MEHDDCINMANGMHENMSYHFSVLLFHLNGQAAFFNRIYVQIEKVKHESGSREEQACLVKKSDNETDVWGTAIEDGLVLSTEEIHPPVSLTECPFQCVTPSVTLSLTPGDD